MKKVAFFLENSCIFDIDVSSIEQGNPGIGGTEYLILLVSLLLSRRDNGICVQIYTLKKQRNLPSDLSCCVVDSIEEAISHAEEANFDSFVLKHDANYVKRDILRTKGTLDIIVWCHVFVCFWELDYYAANPYVKRVVHVGREALELYRDHAAFEKSTYIYNLVNVDKCREKTQRFPFTMREHIVTYIGSLVPYKGFHLLALAWPSILKRVPDAQLYVIGTAKLYDSSCELGSLGLAVPEYEKVFSAAISKEGKLADSIHLMGRMGKEKEEIMLRTKVGVPNPSGITETFCLSAVELQSLGARISTIQAPGYIDTVKNGKLFKNTEQLADCVVEMLLSNNSEYDNAMKYFEKEFAPQIVLSKWEKLLHDGTTEPTLPLKNSSYRGKWLKEKLRLLKKRFPLFYSIPPLERVLLFYERKVLHKTTYMDSNIVLK